MKTYTLVVTAVAAAFIATDAMAISSSFYSVADSRLEEYEFTQTGGGLDYMEINAKTDHRDRGLVMFDLSSIPSGSTINSATMNLYFHYSSGGVSGDTRTHNVHRMTE